MAVRADRFRIKRVYEPASEQDGTRVLIDRLWPRGITKAHAALDLWLKDIAPSPTLRQWFHQDPERWEAFRSKYHAELKKNETGVKQLRGLAAEKPVTLLFGARDDLHNHAIVLLEFLKRRTAPASKSRARPRPTSRRRMAAAD